MLTPADIENPALKAGYNHVNVMNPEGTAFRGQAYAGRHPGLPTISRANHVWYGPTRKTAKAAAQDYCNWVNSGNKPVPRAKLKSAGHKAPQRSRLSDDPEVKAALGVLRDARAQRKGVQGYVYLISDGTAYKIGYSTNPEKRVAELQTGNPRVLRLVAKMKGTESDEKALHTRFHYANLVQEWFRPLVTIKEAFSK
jgi:acylphosphatase